MGVVLAQDACVVGQDLLVQGDGLLKAAHLPVCVCEDVARDLGVGVVLTQDACAVGEDLLVQGDGLPKAAHLPVCACEVVARGQGVGVIWGARALKSGHSNIEGESLVVKPEITRI